MLSKIKQWYLTEGRDKEFAAFEKGFQKTRNALEKGTKCWDEDLVRAFEQNGEFAELSAFRTGYLRAFFRRFYKFKHSYSPVIDITALPEKGDERLGSITHWLHKTKYKSKDILNVLPLLLFSPEGQKLLYPEIENLDPSVATEIIANSIRNFETDFGLNPNTVLEILQRGKKSEGYHSPDLSNKERNTYGAALYRFIAIYWFTDLSHKVKGKPSDRPFQISTSKDYKERWLKVIET